MDEIFFSFVVPVYNVEGYLKRCVDSLIAQQDQGLEVILVDDGSTDKSKELCDKYADQYPWISVVHKANGGLSSARNMGIDQARGDYIFFLDSDDYVDVHMCQKLKEYLEVYTKADVVSIDGYEIEKDVYTNMRRIPLRKVFFTKGEDYLITRYKQRNMNVEACLYLYRREFLNKNKFRFVEGILHEDVEFTYRVIMSSKYVLSVPDAFYYYVIRDGSISTQRDRTKNIQDLFQTLEQINACAEQTVNRELGKWMKNAALNSYLNMIQEARMYQPQYRRYIHKSFLWGKAATPWNCVRVILCTINVRWYCAINDLYKLVRKKI